MVALMVVSIAASMAALMAALIAVNLRYHTNQISQVQAAKGLC